MSIRVLVTGAGNVLVSFAVSLPGRPPQATKLDPAGVSG